MKAMLNVTKWHTVVIKMEATTKDGYTLDISEDYFSIFVRKDGQLIGSFIMAEIVKDGKICIRMTEALQCKK